MNEAFSVRPLSPLRKVIAARMSEAARTIPHFRLGADIAMDALLAVRRTLLEQKPEANVSLNDLLIKATATALMDAPAVNIQWVDGQIHEYRSADIAVVIAIEGGLATPIVRGAELKSIWEIAAEVNDLATRAARNALKMHEIVGGTFSVSNLGMYGIDEFDAIINPPQCAILALGRARPTHVVAPDLSTRIATVLRATLSVDHRALDGATAAAFMTAFRSRVEQPDYLLDAAAQS